MRIQTSPLTIHFNTMMRNTVMQATQTTKTTCQSIQARPWLSKCHFKTLQICTIIQWPINKTWSTQLFTTIHIFQLTISACRAIQITSKQTNMHINVEYQYI
jgi:hypothetical protein